MKTVRVVAALVAVVLVLAASPALAKPIITPGWSPVDPPADRMLFDALLAGALYSVDCGGVIGTGWSADAGDGATFLAALVTTSVVGTACRESSQSPRVRQGDDTYPALPWNSAPAIGVGSAISSVDVPYIDWDFVPSPRVGQWVAIAAAAADGTLLPVREQRITAVDTDSFTLDAPMGEEYVGAPVVDNQARVLGVVARAGTRITGTPLFCGTLFDCTDPTRVWWDITVPSAARDVKATPGKGRVTVTWKPSADSGGDPVSYSHSVNGGPWIINDDFKVTVKARKGQRVSVAVAAVNGAGTGPIVTVSTRAR